MLKSKPKYFLDPENETLLEGFTILTEYVSYYEEYYQRLQGFFEGDNSFEATCTANAHYVLVFESVGQNKYDLSTYRTVEFLKSFHTKMSAKRQTLSPYGKVMLVIDGMCGAMDHQAKKITRSFPDLIDAHIRAHSSMENVVEQLYQHTSATKPLDPHQHGLLVDLYGKFYQDTLKHFLEFADRLTLVKDLFNAFKDR